jgi:tRNA(fMet)-specific endonuclease VapC
MLMSGRFLLDTNIVISLLRADTPVVAKLAAADEVFISAVALAELFYGAFLSQQMEQNVARIEDLAEHSAILACDRGTAREYGLLKSQLRTKGRPIPESDLWIAAQARQHDLTLASADEHFAQVDDLRWERW